MTPDADLRHLDHVDLVLELLAERAHAKALQLELGLAEIDLAAARSELRGVQGYVSHLEDQLETIVRLGSGELLEKLRAARRVADVLVQVLGPEQKALPNPECIVCSRPIGDGQVRQCAAGYFCTSKPPKASGN